MIHIHIGNHGEIYGVHAEGRAEEVATQFAVALCVVYTDLKQNLPPEEAGAFKEMIQRHTDDNSPLWNDPEMKNHIGEGSFVAFRLKEKHAEPEDET